MSLPRPVLHPSLPLVLPVALGVLALAASSRPGRVQEPPASPPSSAETGSYLTRPLWLGEEPPECRSLRRVLVRFGPGAPGRRAREEALGIARRVARAARDGADFEALVAEASEAPEAHRGGVLGTFPPGLLHPAIEAFLWAAEVGEVSEPIEAAGGFQVVQRIERWAGCRMILVRGEGEEARARAEDLLARARSGEDFAALAREGSDDEATRARGGAQEIFERGANDRLLKRATFRASTGEVFGPLETPLGLVIGKRVPPQELPEELRESGWIRVRTIFLAHADVGGSRDLAERSWERAGELARELHARIAAGESMEALAREYDDDRGGRERGGDLGWIRRDNPHTTQALRRAFLADPGELLDPLPLQAGWLLVRRER